MERLRKRAELATRLLRSRKSKRRFTAGKYWSVGAGAEPGRAVQVKARAETERRQLSALRYLPRTAASAAQLNRAAECLRQSAARRSLTHQRMGAAGPEVTEAPAFTSAEVMLISQGAWAALLLSAAAVVRLTLRSDMPERRIQVRAAAARVALRTLLTRVRAAERARLSTRNYFHLLQHTPTASAQAGAAERPELPAQQAVQERRAISKCGSIISKRIRNLKERFL